MGHLLRAYDEDLLSSSRQCILCLLLADNSLTACMVVGCCFATLKAVCVLHAGNIEDYNIISDTLFRNSMCIPGNKSFLAPSKIAMIIASRIITSGI